MTFVERNKARERETTAHWEKLAAAVQEAVKDYNSQSQPNTFAQWQCDRHVGEDVCTVAGRRFDPVRGREVTYRLVCGLAQELRRIDSGIEQAKHEPFNLIEVETRMAVLSSGETEKIEAKSYEIVPENAETPFRRKNDDKLLTLEQVTDDILWQFLNR